MLVMFLDNDVSFSILINPSAMMEIFMGAAFGAITLSYISY